MIVKLQGSGYLVNNQKSVPNDPRNSDYQAVQRWLIGHTDEWLALKAQHDKEVAEHENWVTLRDSFEATEAVPVFELPEPSITPLPDPVPNTPLPEFTQEELDAQEANKVRAKRDALLAEADILMFKAFDNNEDTTALKSYRQELRDMTTQVGFPYDVTYPVLG